MNNNFQTLNKILIALTLASIIIGVAMVFTNDILFITGKTFTICIAFIFFGITGTIALAGARKPENNLLGIIGGIISALSFMLTLITILGEISNEQLLKITFSTTILSIAFAHICLLLYFNIRNKYAMFARIAAITAISLFSALIITQIFSPMSNLYMMYSMQSNYKFILAVFVIDLGATLLVPLFNRLQPPASQELDFTSSELTDTDPAI